MRLHLLHENDDWLPPLRRALDAAGLPYAAWFLDGGVLDVQGAPPEGVYFNRMSASAHTRGHAAGVPYARRLLDWLARHDRRVVNGLPAFELEMSKTRQYAALGAAGLRTPRTRTVVAHGDGAAEAWIEAAQAMTAPFITKHDRGGKGLGVQLFRSHDAFAEAARAGHIPPPPDGVLLLQQYIEAPAPFITRCEFVGGRFVYAVRVDTSEGFELCPAEACRTGERCMLDGPDAAPPPSGDGAPDASGAPEAGDPLFTLRDDVDAGLIARYEAFLAREQIDVAGIEFIEDADGRAWTYDVNGTTNYNPAIEAAAPRSAWDAVADLLAQELAHAKPQVPNVT
jgi:hypothetical protein